MSHPIKRFKVVLIGDAGSGKTAYIRRLMSYNDPNYVFEHRYVPTHGSDLYSLMLHTNYGNYILDIWDVAGQEKYGCLRWVHYVDVEAALVFFDMTSANSYKNSQDWFKDITGVNTIRSVVKVGSKCDIVHHKKIKYEPDVFVYEISSKTNNIYEPLLWTVRILTGKTDLEFT